MIHERFPDQFGLRDVTPTSKRPWCEAADVVFTNSNHTRDDLLERFGLPEDKVVATPLGVTVVPPRAGPLPFADGQWILYVGERSKPYKNWTGALDALVALGPEARLACFGPPANAEDNRAVADRGLTERVRFVGGDDRDLARLRSCGRTRVPISLRGVRPPPARSDGARLPCHHDPGRSDP